MTRAKEPSGYSFVAHDFDDYDAGKLAVTTVTQKLIFPSSVTGFNLMEVSVGSTLYGVIVRHEEAEARETCFILHEFFIKP